MCIMRGLYCLCCCWGYIKFQITITVCWCHWGQEIFRGLSRWTEWLLMPIISRYLSNISNIVDHWYLSFKLPHSDKSLWFLNMTPVLLIKCSKPSLHKHGLILYLGKAWLEFCCDEGVGEICGGLWKIDNKFIGSQPGWTQTKTLVLFLWGNVCGFLEALPYLLHQSHSCPKTISNVGVRKTG